MTGGVFSTAYRATTAGVFALGFLIAFEALAVTTAMPLAARDLHGTALYAFTFSAFAATSVVGTVVSGAWSDRIGPPRPLILGVLLFTAGLVAAGTASTMPVLLAARGVQGLGAGSIAVALYVLVARVYRPELRPRVFALLAAAWVLPALVGPFASGATAQFVSWHWVFLGIVPLVVAAVAVLAPTLRRIPPTPEVHSAAAPAALRVAAAIVAAIGLLVLRPASAVPAVGPLLASGAAAVSVLSLRPLLPVGALHAARGLPAVVTTRALLSGGFAAADAYLPYSLIALRHVPPSIAGGITTVGAVAWAVGSAAQSRLPRVTDRACLVAGAVAFTVGAAGVALVSATTATLPLLVSSWLVTGLGIGLAYPRTSTATLALSAPDRQGASSAALQIGDGFGNGLALAVVGVVSASTGADGFADAFGVTVVVGLLLLAVTPRAATRPPRAVA